jgi:CheY-like chemotaxis protein
VSQKSITLAAEENRKIHREHDDRDSWMHYPEDKPIAVINKDIPSPEHVSMPTIDSPSSKKPAPSANLSYSAQKKQLRQEVRAQGLTAPTANSSGRKNWGAQRGEVQGGAANFYKEVKVCGVCAQVYGLLDQSRELLYLEEEKKFEAEKVKSLSDYTDHRDYHVTKDHHLTGHHEHATEQMGEEGGGEKGVMRTRLGRELFSLSLNNPLGLDESTMPPQMGAIDESGEDLETTFLSPVKTKNGKAQFANSMRSPSLPKPRATWKDHVAHDEDIGDYHKQDQAEASGKKGKKNKKTKKTPQKLSAAQQVKAKGNDPHFEVLDDYLKGTKRLQHTVAGRKHSQLTGGKEAQERLNAESNRYHAKILIGDPDKESAMRAKEALEPSGYIVNWVENGADCVEMMQETSYDAILIERDMAVMNSFDVAKWTRDKEKKARIDNAKLRAQQNMTKTSSFARASGTESDRQDIKVRMDRESGCALIPIRMH